MRYLTLKNGLLAIAVAGLITAGCLVSGTFVVVESVNFEFTANTGFYWYPVDLTDNEEWEDHEEDIDDIDALGLEFLIENTSSQTCELNVWFVAATGDADPNTLTPPTQIPTSGTVHVVKNLVVAAGATRKVSYQESVGFLTGAQLEAFKKIILSGRFDYFGTSCGGTGDDEFRVTQGKIIITVSASST